MNEIDKSVNTTKEIKFYISKIITIGLMFASVILIGFLSVTFFFIDYYSYETPFTTLVLAITFLIICSISFIWSTYMLFFNPLLLTINNEGLDSPKTGKILWNKIKVIYIPKSFWNFEREASFIKIILTDDTSRNLNTRLFSIRPMDLLEILKSYQETYK
jgi:hypothetical protein